MLNVLLAVDDSEASRRAAAKVAEMGGWWKADRLDLLNVQPDQSGFGEPLPYAIQQKAEALARAAGERVLEAARGAMTKVPPVAGGTVELGDPATQIAGAAERLDSTLIVVGFHGAGALEALFMGSVTTKVLHLTRRPVLVIPSSRLKVTSAYGPPQRPVKILMPVDGSPGALAAVRVLVGIAGSFRTAPEIHLIAVYHRTPIDVALEGMVSGKTIADHTRQQFEASLQPARDVLAEANLSVTEHTAVGLPVQQIHAAISAQGCDLAFIGTRGMGAVRNLVLGSTTAKLLRGAEVPVLVVPTA